MESLTLEELKSKLEDEFSDYYEVAGGKNYRYSHLQAVHAIVEKLIKELDVEVDEKVVEIAALYHDIGRSEDIEDGEMDPFEGHEGHDQRGKEKVAEFVSEYVTQDQLEKIQKIIGNHHSEPETVEGKIVQDADKLSKFGVNNLWRQFHYACEHEIEFRDSINYFWETAVDDYRALMEKMYFDHTQEVAEKRLEKQKEVFERIEKEMNAEDV
jgi:putative nucleotidyltransferase with HDIG domain